MYLWYLGYKVGHTISFAINLQEFSTEEIANACKKIVTSHPALWMFFEKNYPLINFIKIQKNWSCIVVDLSDHHNKNKEIDQLYKKYSLANPWLNHGPPMIECILIKTGELVHVMHVHVSHAVFDGFSLTQFMKELEAQLKGNKNIEIQFKELESQFIYDESHAQELQQIVQQHEVTAVIGWERLSIQHSWKGRLFPKDICVSIDDEIVEKTKFIGKKLNLSYRELVFALCSMTLQNIFSANNMLVCYLCGDRDEENSTQFGYLAKAKFFPIINFINPIERVQSVILSLRNATSQEFVKGAHMMYAIEKEGLLYRMLSKLVRKKLFKGSATFYYPEQAIADYTKAAVLQILSKPSIFTETIKTTLIYNDSSVSDEQVNDDSRVVLQNVFLGTKSRKLHGRQVIMANPGSAKIEFTFQNWEGRASILYDLFIKEFGIIVNELYN